MDIVGGFNIFEKLFKRSRFLLKQHRKDPSQYLNETLTPELGVAYRIVKLPLLVPSINRIPQRLLCFPIFFRNQLSQRVVGSGFGIFADPVDSVVPKN